MAETLTKQQQQAVHDRGGKLLVSAAAGSGKTKVLIDRLLSYLQDPVDPANLDTFLIITYTKAAASELRGKIAKRLSEAVAQSPENRHLQNQLQRLYLTKISTVHAFCTDILREYAYRLDISSDFRVVDENECFELMNKVMEQVLDNAYAHCSEDPDFCAFIDTQGFGRDDRQIPEIILKVHNSSRCHLDPEEWLDWCVAVGGNNQVEDAAQTVWGQYLISDLHNYLDLQIATIQNTISCTVGIDHSEKITQLLGQTVDQLSALRHCRTWDEIYHNKSIEYGRLTFSAKFSDSVLKEQIKAVRENCKKGLAAKLRRFSMNSEQLLGDIQQTQSATRGLIGLVRQFSEGYSKAKRNRRVLDFGDLEHKMLDLLAGKSRKEITTVAKEIGSRFREVMVDEYQDTNAVQDAIFNALTTMKQNCFMVGDVKQSIYQFRLADPGIFLDKYDTYKPAEEAKYGEGRKILLSRNFRSASNVIRAVNDVFTTCMNKRVGGLIYGEDEQLYEGIPHDQIQEREVELYALEGNDDVYSSEAAFVANKILDLLDGTHIVRGKSGPRPITPEDIVILLRSPGSVGGVYQTALECRGIRCVSGGSVDMLHAEEIEVMRSFLQVINNPLQDIPLLAVLTSRVVGFNADELVRIRSRCKYASIFEALSKTDMPKAVQFLDLLTSLRKEAQLSNLPQLLMYILTITHMDSIYAAMPDGVERTENLQCFCALAAGYETSVGGGLPRFLEHLSIMEKRGLEINVEPNKTDSVRIMSIHKSKGLEFPVVFLCGLSKEFNLEGTRAQVLCDKDLGLGLSCLDGKNAVRYPTLAKQAIAEKMVAESVSEEMRVLYVAMTRAQDRLIMTYTQKKIDEKLSRLQNTIALTKPELLTLEAGCSGHWILQTALSVNNDFWYIQNGCEVSDIAAETVYENQSVVPDTAFLKIKNALYYTYPHMSATQTPSKQTATQIKGRTKDLEAAEQTVQNINIISSWRRPSFVQPGISTTAYGKAMHTVMQYIRYDACTDTVGVNREIRRLIQQNCITQQEAEIVNAHQIARFFQTDIGTMLKRHPNVVREFKFSILDSAEKYCDDIQDEMVLLQGVVDCAMISDDGIVILDFKTDRVAADMQDTVSAKYRSQILAYAGALGRIFEKPVKSAYLYFFSTDSFVKII